MSRTISAVLDTEQLFEQNETVTVYSSEEEQEVFIKVKGSGDTTGKFNGKKPGTADNTNKKKN